MSLKFMNYSQMELSGSISSGDTSIALVDASGIPTLGTGDFIYLTLFRVSDQAKEIIKVTAKSGNTITAERAQDGTTALTLFAGDKAEPWLNKKILEEIVTLGSAGQPVGSYMLWPTGTPPSGYLECDGTAISRTTYNNLFDAIGTSYGVGDGVTTFNLPDFRGYTFRGWDNGAGVDPDAGSRTDRGDGTTGDNVGTKQADEFKSHNHINGLTDTSGNLNNYSLYGTVDTANTTSSISDNTTNGTHSAYTSSEGGNETRMKNINVMVCIKVSTTIEGSSLVDTIEYVKEWADKDEDSLISVEAGGNNSDDYSARHHSAKANAQRVLAETAKTNAETAEANAQTAEANAQTARTGAETAEANALSHANDAQASAVSASSSDFANWKADTILAAGSGAGATSQGSYSIAVGASSGLSSQGNNSVAIGREAGKTTQGYQSVAIGYFCGRTTQGNEAVAIGREAGNSSQGANTVAIGREAGESSQGSQAIAIGRQAGETSQTSDTIAIGYQAGQSSLGANCTAIGYRALTATTGANNLAIGHKAGNLITSGSENTTLGAFALDSNIIGIDNTACGYATLSNSTSSSNSCFGSASLFNITTGANNVAIGVSSGRYIAGGATANQTSGTSCYIGANTKAGADGNSNEIVIGYNATGNGSNTVTLGNTSITETHIQGALALEDGITAPSTITGRAALYVDSADGDLKIKFSDGTIKTIVVDT